MMRKLLSFFILSILLLTHVRTCAQPDSIRYGGTVAIMGSGHNYVSKSYRIKLLANVDSNGTFPLIAPNSTFNEVLFNGSHVRLVLEGNSSAIPVGDRYASFLLPFLVTLYNGSIEEVSLLTRDIIFEALEIIETKRGGIAEVKLNNEYLIGSWVGSVGGWLFRRSWDQQGELSYLLILDNGTYLTFRGVSKVNSSQITLKNIVKPYEMVEIKLKESSVILRAFGPSIKPVRSDSVKLERGLLLYEGSRSLLEIEELGGAPYEVLDPMSCSVCEFNGNKFYFDSSFRIDIQAEVPSEIISGTSFRISLKPPDGSRAITLIFEDTSIVLEDIRIPMRIEMRAPAAEKEYNATLLITVETGEGIFGQEKGIRILPAYRVSLVNSTRVYLLGGKGSLHIRLYNSGSIVARISGIRMDLFGDNTPIMLSFPVYDQVPPGSSVTVPLSLNVPVGQYTGKISLNITDSLNKTYTLVPSEDIKIYSTVEDPVNIFALVVPENPNLGDDVKLIISLSSAIPLRRLLVNVSSADMSPTSDTSKLLANLSDWETVRLEFSFKTKAVGSSSILISAYYLPEGYSTYRATFKEVSVSVGGVSGRVIAEAKKMRVAVNESVEVTMRIESSKGEVTLEFPKGVFIVESQGVISGNKLKVVSPSQSRVVLRFNSSGSFTVPSLALLNDTRLLQVDAAQIYVVSEAESEKERELKSKLADLNRRYKTLVETLRGSTSYQEPLNMIRDLFNESEVLINERRYSDAERLLKKAEDIIISMEEGTYTRIGDLFNFLIYFMIGGGFALLLFIVRRVKKGSRAWK
ncbi:MAG: hypothetical protein QXU23_01320 [Candidatus Korarchaeum sp.]